MWAAFGRRIASKQAGGEERNDGDFGEEARAQELGNGCLTRDYEGASTRAPRQ